MSKIKVDTIESRNGTLTVGASGDTVVYTSGSIPNSSLENSAITINGSSVSLGGSVDVGGAIDWQTTAKTTAFTAVAGEGYFVDTSSGAITATLPASPSAGDQVAFKDYAATFNTNALTIARNGSNIQGFAADNDITTIRASVVLVYVDSTKGWLYTNESNVSDFSPPFITATGGTITTSGDFKIHTFTSSGTFTVTNAGQPTGSTTVDYLVIAGGGGGGQTNGGAGGGAGGYRESFPNPATGGFPITVQAYPITVGAGGAGGTRGANGSSSVFSTITSAAGGGGGAADADPAPAIIDGYPGGSGGGGGSRNSTNGSGGTGNSPSVSPPQGNPGGNGSTDGTTYRHGGGGGGASAAGGNAPTSAPAPGGTGGNGSPSSINGSNVTRGGGGGGGSFNPAVSTPGGTGGGGAGAPLPGDGVANTGGGGGGNGRGSPAGNGGADGGSGIVIIRYKFQ